MSQGGTRAGGPLCGVGRDEYPNFRVPARSIDYCRAWLRAGGSLASGWTQD